MKHLIVFLAFLTAFSVSAFCNMEVELGPSMQLDISTYNFLYSYSFEGTAMISVGYPALMGIKYDFQDNFQRLAILGDLRLLPPTWRLKIDIIGGGGIASINGSDFQYPFATGGIEPKYFLGEDQLQGPFIYVNCFFMDITTEIAAYSFLNFSGGIGMEF